MKSYCKYCLAVVLLFLFCSCSDKNKKGNVELGSYHLVVLSHTENGELLDYMVFNDLSGISLIRVLPKKGHTDIYVTLYGSKQHELLQKDMTIYSKVAEGYKGNVEVSIQDGIAVAVMGNGFKTPNPITDAAIEAVINAISKGLTESEGNDSFEVIK
jgi:hypothetical protein